MRHSLLYYDMTLMTVWVAKICVFLFEMLDELMAGFVF